MMLKDIVKKIDSAIPSLFPVDPARFSDPVALQTGWKRIRSFNANRASSSLVEINPELLMYKPSVAGIIFGSLFILVGGVVLFFYILIEQGNSNIIFPTASAGLENPIILTLVALVFSAFGIVMIFSSTSPVAFDKQAGIFYKGRRQRRFQDAEHSKNALRFSDIHAIQLLTYLKSSSNNKGPTRFYLVYEMNLVQHNGERTHVNTYSKPDRARSDAAKIGSFVHAPVWDGIDG